MPLRAQLLITPHMLMPALRYQSMTNQSRHNEQLTLLLAGEAQAVAVRDKEHQQPEPSKSKQKPTES
jgi:hypothetical protein